MVEIDDAATRLWGEIVQNLLAMGKHVFFIGTQNKYAFVKSFLKLTRVKISKEIYRFEDKDHALEWCEDHLLNELGSVQYEESEIDIEQQALRKGLSKTELASITSACKLIHLKTGDCAFKRGDVANSMYFIKKGAVEVLVRVNNKRVKRLNTLSAGMPFGELAMLNRNTRTAEIKAIKDTLCCELRFDDIEDIIKTKMLANLAGMLAKKLEKDAREIATLY